MAADFQAIITTIQSVPMAWEVLQVGIILGVAATLISRFITRGE